MFFFNIVAILNLFSRIAINEMNHYDVTGKIVGQSLNPGSCDSEGLMHFLEFGIWSLVL
jgi:hypothetical protein